MADLSLEIHHLDVRGGDSTAIIVKDLADGSELYRLLIDAGAEGKGSAALKSYLEAYLPGAFDCIIATHYHQDHIQGFSQAGIKFKKFMDNGGYTDGHRNLITPRNGIGAGAQTAVYESYKHQVQKISVGTEAPTRIRIPFAESGFNLKNAAPVQLELGRNTGIKLTCYCANGVLANGKDALGEQRRERTGARDRKTISPNDVSLAFVVEWGNFRYFTAGDLSGDRELSSYHDIEKDLVDYLTGAGGPLRGKPITVYKASHHGSEHSNHKDLLKALAPETVVVCCNIQKQVPSPVFLTRLKKYLDTKAGATAVFTNTMKIFERDDRYPPLYAMKDFIATNNVKFGDEDGNTRATNLGVKCAVIRRRAVNGMQTPYDATMKVKRALETIAKTGYEIVLLKRDPVDEQAIASAVRFVAYDIRRTWEAEYCSEGDIESGFKEQARRISAWLAQDGVKDISEGIDYVTEHYPGLLATVKTSQDKKVIAKEMLDLFQASFFLDDDDDMYKRQANTLTHDQKMTLYNLLMNNVHQKKFNIAIKNFNRPRQQRFDPKLAWNVEEFPEPYPKAVAPPNLSLKRAADETVVRRSKRFKEET